MEKITEKSVEWINIWFGFIADLFDEWGYFKIREEWQISKNILIFDSIVEKLDLLHSIRDVVALYSGILDSRDKPSLDDIYKIGSLLNKIDSKIAVKNLKQNIENFLKKYPK